MNEDEKEAKLEEIKNLFELEDEDGDNDYLEFEKIPEDERLHPHRDLCAFLKVVSLLEDPSEFRIAGEHDIVYLNDLDDVVEKITPEDVVYLRRCGVHYDDDSSCLAVFC